MTIDELCALFKRVHADAAATGVVDPLPCALDAVTKAVRDEAERRGRAAERADVVADARKMAKRQTAVFGDIGEAVLLDFADEVEAGRHVGAASSRKRE